MVASLLHRYSLTVLPPRQAHRHAALAPALCSRSLHAASLHASLGLPASALAGFVTKAFLPSPMPLLASWQRPSPGWPHGDGLPAFAAAGCGAGCRRMRCWLPPSQASSYSFAASHSRPAPPPCCRRRPSSHRPLGDNLPASAATERTSLACVSLFHLRPQQRLATSPRASSEPPLPSKWRRRSHLLPI